MLQIELWCVARYDEQKPASAIAGLSVLTLPVGNKENYFSVYLGDKYARTQACVLATIASLQSIKDDYRKEIKTRIHVPSRYMYNLFIKKTNGDWYFKPVKYAELIGKMRFLFTTYSKIEAVRYVRDRRTIECINLAEKELLNGSK